MILRFFEISRRRFADLLLFGVTSVELVVLVLLTPTFTVADWIYVLQHLMVLGIALTREAPKVRDYSLGSSIAVGVAYIYPYAQVIYLRLSSGYVVWPAAGLALVTLAAGLSLVSLLTIGRVFGVRTALRDLVTSGPYRSGTTYRNRISSHSSLCWSVGRLWSTASKPRSEYSLNMPRGRRTWRWYATAFSLGFGEVAIPMRP